MNIFESASRPEILQFKIACKSDELSDDEIQVMFMNFEIESEKEIKEIIDILRRFRPNVHQEFNNQLLKK